MSSVPLPDAAPANWVDRHAPPALRPWLKLGRFDRPTGIWLLMLPGWQGIALADAIQRRWPDPALLALFFLGATLMRSAGCAYNDIVDRDLDAKVARTAGRPVASGQIGAGAAWAFVVVCSLASLGILLCLNGWSVVLGIASLALVAAYPFMKRITWWPQAWLGLTFNWGALLGFAAASKPSWFEGQTVVHLSGLPVALSFFATAWLPALLLYAGGVFWTLGYDTIYAVQDLEDDALAGVKSSARRLGASAPRAVAIFYAISLALVLAAGRGGGLGWASLPLLALAGAQLAWQARRLKLDDPAGALRLFRSNTLTGFLVFAAMAAGAWR
ncbi:MAG TPA: 4-hydroxybenzoate octaprenyltransferase [Caulobacteraceae bacterium]|nr:4-hydroxybenzoate octaprenyltransferase [Caulobacteraceae bacterium]